MWRKLDIVKSFSTETSPLIRRDDDIDYHNFNLQQSVVQAQQVVYSGNYYFLWQSLQSIYKMQKTHKHT